MQKNRIEYKKESLDTLEQVLILRKEIRELV